ncbi:Glutathione-regulated potassium-efflux system protein KefC [Methylobacterium adhaesivum]|jgi:CPA2 family monovalent cation:H+ antiporter-2/glutathione-regulated potassium-efflux system protein KefB|uniref:Monovalent cation:proton antiporter-2 (CPA2) family protein n=1 Tax=Methylobacterium adhaesivum TaxID=333297 RepID=A0ABT8BKG2_9HYPH|nr:monovalent cation:proton antiporter-2 (CPA2) family protein [Methylobacterium adhaesivum]MDN3592667.1 monovalent cation:proton antiporter-2 (CPA2) family protein [Methylobacterium adhaesivum]GJD29301.1 Glutathione-regulated potassium-efflux system protein KefC [Methylobacterium adhaesivum]
MASAATHVSFLPPVLTFLSAAVIGVPIFRLIGQSAVLGYLVAGVVIGPFGFSLIAEPETAASVAELGVVLLLFIVGLELQVSRLVSMRRDIFGLGTAQLLVCTAVLAGIGFLLGLKPSAAFVIGIALALSATAVALQLLEERGDLGTPYGGRAFAVLLFQDISVVAILALMPLLASTGVGSGDGWLLSALQSTGTVGAAILAVVLVGRYGLNPFFGLLAASGAREVMTAAALLVVLGTAMLMEHVGLSMAMGAFLAGVLLAESNFRHQLEADIEPFRGMLLGLFFMSVGMSIDGGLLKAEWPWLLGATAGAILIKVALVAGLFRLFGSPWLDAVRGGAILAPAGEFAFVLLPVGGELGLIDGPSGRFAIALAALTMLVGPVAAKALDSALARRRAEPDLALDPVETTEARVLVIGFGRFGQILTQVLLAEGIGVTVIDKDVEQIRSASRFGFRIFYGDGTRLDVLRAAGIGRAELLCVCVDEPEAALKIVDIVHEEFATVRTYVRAYDRMHAVELMNRDVDFQLRETVDSALAFGRATLEGLGVAPDAAAAVAEDVRKRDVARLVLQQAGALPDAANWMRGISQIKPEPLTEPRRPSRALNAETRDIIGTRAREAATHTLEARDLPADA